MRREIIPTNVRTAARRRAQCVFGAISNAWTKVPT